MQAADMPPAMRKKWEQANALWWRYENDAPSIDERLAIRSEIGELTREFWRLYHERNDNQHRSNT